MVQQSIVNAKGQHAKRNIFAEIWGRTEQRTEQRTERRAERRAERTPARVADALAYEDYVTLADGQVLIVPRGNLAAAKGLLAAQRAAERRVAAQQAARTSEAANEEARGARMDDLIGAAGR